MTFDLDAFRLSVANDPIIRDVWEQKYRFENEASPQATRKRVVDAILPGSNIAQHIIGNGYFCPAGRILAGAGTGRRVTMANCFVGETIQDNMYGIQRAIMRAALTMQQGGGHGSHYGTIRPNGAIVKRTGSTSSGMLPFADQQDAMCKTIMSAATRRGAQMLTLRDDHPDLWNGEQFETTTNFIGETILKNPSFISAKRQKGRLTNFNVSVMITDAFMQAVERGDDWDLGFHVPRADGNHVCVYDKPFPYDYYEIDNESNEELAIKKGTIMPWYVYRRVPARRVWEDLMRSTYTYAEPGVIFVDKVNKNNNLNYCEEIWATNPCFAGDTLIVTDQGAYPIKDLAGKAVNVFDGDRWTLVDNFRVTGHNQQMLEFEFQDGATLKVTKAHGMILEDGTKKPASELVVGDSVKLCDVEYDGPVQAKGAYIKGFLLGDGQRRGDRESVALFLYHTKYCCEERLIQSAREIPQGALNTTAIVTLGFTPAGKDPKRRIMQGLAPLAYDLLPWATDYKEGLPVEVFTWDRASKLAFLEGLFDADGTANDSAKNGFKYQIWAVSKKLLFGVQTLLKSIGVRSKISLGKSAQTKEMPGGSYDCQDCWRLTIAQKSSIRLAQQTNFARVPSFAHKTTTNFVKCHAGQVVDVRQFGLEQTVYCCTVSTNHRLSLAIGITTANCGEQPLPPHGICNLGSINLAFLVKRPFTSEAHFDYNTYCTAIDTGVRFLDQVLDKMNYPLRAQYEESMQKRRIGLGITGLGDALLQLGITYGSLEALDFSDTLAATLKERSYLTSIDLGEELGSFKAFDLEQFGKSPNLTPDIRNYLYQKGAIRNGVINTIAPNGTISLYLGNLASGVEPVFSFAKTRRRVRQSDGGFKEYDVVNYSQRMFEAIYPGEPLPEYFVGAMDITPEQHVDMQAVWQQHIDSSISKTCNVPTEMSYEDFKNVYWHAYKSGCKGCTTYRYDPEAGRGFVLAEESQLKGKETKNAPDETTYTGTVAPRPATLDSRTYKIRWPSGGRNGYHNLYVTVSRDQSGVPMEVFITTKEAGHHEWVTALGRMITAILRRGGDVRFLPHELMEVHSAAGGGWIKGRFRPSVVAAIGGVIEEEFAQLGILTTESIPPAVEERYEGEPLLELEEKHDTGLPCPKCHAPTLVHEAGCSVCKTCGYSTCE